MTSDKNNPNQSEKQPQTAETGEKHINPFRDAGNDNGKEPSPEEQADLEQQLKEAMTERD